MANIILYDKGGNANTYSDTDSLEVDTTEEGVTAIFSEGEKATKAVELDMSGGNQIVEPDAGTLLSKVTVRKPDTLVSENIRKNVNIGGVWGTYIGGDALVSAYGEYTPTEEGLNIIEHGMKIPPDFIRVWTQVAKTGCIVRAEGYSAKLQEKCNLEYANSAQTYGELSLPMILFNEGIETADEYGHGVISNATPKQFKIGGSLFKHSVGDLYCWEAIGGIIAHTDYFYIRLEFDSRGYLIVSGGVPEIEKLNVVANGVTVKTVDYIHGEVFEIDISDVCNSIEPFTFAVEAIGDGLSELYPNQYSDTITNGIVAAGTCGDSATWRLTEAGELIISGTGPMADCTSSTEQPWYAYASAITSITVNEGITHIGSQSLRGTNAETIAIPESAVSIGKSAFYGNTQLKSIVLPGAVSEMGSYVFGGCTALERVELSPNITVIGAYMFHQCAVLNSVEIPDGVTTIGAYAFYCSGIEEIIIPDSVTSIGTYICYDCNSLKRVVVGSGVTHIPASAFRMCELLESITLRGNITQIDDYAFADAAITEIKLPDSLTLIGLGVFYSCTKLRTITIPANVKQIYKTAFYNCAALTSAIFSVTSGWYRGSSAGAKTYSIPSSSLANTSTAATYLRSTYYGYYWTRS